MTDVLAEWRLWVLLALIVIMKVAGPKLDTFFRK